MISLKNVLILKYRELRDCLIELGRVRGGGEVFLRKFNFKG